MTLGEQVVAHLRKVAYEQEEAVGRPQLSYVEALEKYTGLPRHDALSREEWENLFFMPIEEQEWRIAFLRSLWKIGVAADCQEMGIEEYRKLLFMQPEDQEEWRTKLSKQQSQKIEKVAQSEGGEPQHQIQPESWTERLKSSDHQFIKKVSLQVPMHPEMREQVAALAASYGLGSGEFVEQVLAEKLAHSSDRVKEGRELMGKQEFKRPYRAKLHVLRKEIEQLRQGKSPQRG